MVAPKHTFANCREGEFCMRWAGHSHVCRESGDRMISLADWRDRLRGMGLNYFGFGHPWESWDLETIRSWELDSGRASAYHEGGLWRTTGQDVWLRSERFERWKRELSAPDFVFGVDLETPKIRYGHLWWIGWQPEGVAPWHDYDKPWTAWETSMERDRGISPPPFRRRFPAEAIRVQHSMGALPVYAHPTSWWFDPQGRHITNLAATLVPDILTGQACGAMVVMGYQANHRHYQDLWFHLLDHGYFVTGVAETDACLDFETPFPRALFQNIARTRSVSEGALREAVVAGRNVMTTGPDLKVSCGDAVEGGFVAERGGSVQIRASGLAPGDRYLLEGVTNGGRITFSLSTTGCQHMETVQAHEGGGWLVVKLVNESRPYDAAMTNPVFFAHDPVRVTAQKPPATPIAWWELPDARALLDDLAHGQWRRNFPSCEPGEVPPSAFRWDSWQSIL